MKKILLFSALFVSLVTFAQVPQGISYQAIALNSSGTPVVSSTVGIRLSILDNGATGTVLYTEAHSATTNAQGLFQLVIGQGTPTLGTFSTIKWETNTKYLKVEMDATGGTTYVLVGTTQLLSVPYALYAGKVDQYNIVGGPDLNYSYTTAYTSSIMTATNAYVFAPDDYSNDDGIAHPYSWHTTPISGTPFMKSQNAFLTSDHFYWFGQTDPTNTVNIWHSYAITGQPVKIIPGLIITSTNAYFVDVANGNYVLNPVNIAGDFVASVESNIHGLGFLTTTNAYLANNGVWQSIAISGTPLKIKYLDSGLMFLTTTNAYIYSQDTTDDGSGNPLTYSWHTLSLSGTPVLD